MLLSFPELVAAEAGDIRCVDIRTAKSELAENGGVLIDVREPAEYAAQSATGAHNIPRGVLEIQTPQRVSDPDTPLYTHCASGGRARLAAAQLTRLGYRNVTAISCGIDTICEALNGAG